MVLIKRIFLSFLVAVAILAGLASAEPINITDCQNLDIENAEYILQNDVFADGNCFDIQADGITLDLNGYDVSGNGNGWAIYITEYDSLTVKNGKIYNFSKGIRPVYSNNNIIKNNKILNNFDGIDISYSNDNIIVNNYIDLNFDRGIGILNNVSNNVVTNNFISNNGRGIYFGLGSDENIVHNNYFSNTENVNLGNGRNNWNINLIKGGNIINGSLIGGNFWGKPDGTGFSQTCDDLNHDGICDSAYSIDDDNADYFPLTYFSFSDK